LDALDGGFEWAFHTTQLIESSPAVADSKVFFGGYDSYVYALDVVSGGLVWSFKTSSYILSSPAVADGNVYIGSSDWRVYAFAGHDVAVDYVVPSKTRIPRGYPLTVNVSVANYGSFPEIFNVTVYANSDAVGSVTGVNLTRGNRTVVTVAWNGTGFGYGDYLLWAVAEPVVGESDVADNTCFAGVYVHVGVAGDITSVTPGVPDGRVDIRDVTYLILAFQSRPGSPNWNPGADVDENGVIDIRDITIAILHFYQHE
jgi:outer membrane protein assembly factor BamB